MKRMTVNRASFGVLDVGTGAPIVLLHGFSLDHSMWKAQIAALSPAHRMIAPDLRGQGASEIGEGAVTMRQMADDVDGMLDALQVTEAVILCGLSMGGYIAWEFWQHHRDRLAKLILCDTRAAADAPEVARARQLMAAYVVTSGATVAVEAMLPKLFAPRTYQEQPELVEHVREVILTTDPRSIAALQRAMAMREDMTARLREIDVPTLVVCGADDQISPPSEMREMAASLPSATYVEIANAGHLPPLEQPSATNEAIQRFLL